MGLYGVVILRVPRVIDFAMRERQGWQPQRVREFIDGFKRSVLTAREEPKSEWPEFEKRGFRFGESLSYYCRLHGICEKQLLKAALGHEFEHPRYSKSERTSARSLFKNSAH